MADQTNNDSTLTQIEKFLNEEEYGQTLSAWTDVPRACNIHESASSVGTTPDPLNTAFINEAAINEQQDSPINLFQQQSQTTKETSSTVHQLIEAIIDLPSTTKTMTSTGTMPQTPIKMLSSATMPGTPTGMKSIGTMPGTPTGVKSTGTLPTTPIEIRSIGTMPQTPITKVSTGTMPKTPTMASTGTMPKTPTASSPASSNDTIDLRSSTPSTIDLVSPTIETIDLRPPHTTTNTN